ncbi:MAG TPA: MlaD family protein [Bryobacteraceae bacterium]|nr:MlaD family protein [Bryobacteraceae bacterium]
MADPKKVSFAQLRVGVMAIVAMIIVAVLIFLLTGQKNIFARTFELRTFMSDSGGITEGSPVRLNGILVGDVATLKLSGSKDPRRIVELDMEIKYDFLTEIPKDSMAGIAAANLLGNKFININRGTQANHVAPGDELQSAPVQDIPELLAQSSKLLDEFQGLLKRVDALLSYVESGQGNIGLLLKDKELYTRLNSTIAEAQQILVDVRTGKGTLSRLIYDDTLANDVHATLDKLNAILAELQQGRGTAGKLLKDEALYADLRHATDQFNQLVSDLQAGRGSAGKILKDDRLYNQINQLVAKVDTTVDKLNSGQGTLGQLMVNPQLYESLNGATGELHQLIKDMRANPKKFLRIKLAIF